MSGIGKLHDDGHVPCNNVTYALCVKWCSPALYSVLWHAIIILPLDQLYFEVHVIAARHEEIWDAATGCATL